MKMSGTINMPIGRSTKDRKKMAVSKDGKEAVTDFKVLKRYEGFSLGFSAAPSRQGVAEPAPCKRFPGRAVLVLPLQNRRGL